VALRKVLASFLRPVFRYWREPPTMSMEWSRVKSLTCAPQLRATVAGAVCGAEDEAHEVTVDGVLLQVVAQPVLDPEPALGPVVVALGHEGRGCPHQARVLQLDEVLPEVVLLHRRQGVEAEVFLEGGLLGGEVGELGLLPPHEPEELEERALVLPGGPEVERALLDAGAVAEPVGRLGREPAVERDSSADGSGVAGDGSAQRPPRPSAELSLEARPVGRAHAGEVDRAPVGGRPVAGGADPPLDLDGVDGAGEVPEVGEVEGLVLGVLERHAVEGDVEAGLGDAAEVEVGVAGGEAVVGVEVG